MGAAPFGALHLLALRPLAPFRARVALPSVPLPSAHFTRWRGATLDKKPLVLAIVFWYLPRIEMPIRPTSQASDDGVRPVAPRRRERRIWSHAALFAACVVLANGLFGERGLADGLRARRTYAAAAEQLARLREENAALRERARALQNDPSAIETVARGELGLVRPGEILVTVRDVK